MAGRRRRTTSNSTVATVDDRTVKWTKELSFLKRAPNDLDEWSSFEMSDAVIYHKDGKTVANLLNIDLEGPYIVRGRVDASEKQYSKLRTCRQITSSLI